MMEMFNLRVKFSTVRAEANKLVAQVMAIEMPSEKVFSQSYKKKSNNFTKKHLMKKMTRTMV